MRRKVIILAVVFATICLAVGIMLWQPWNQNNLTQESRAKEVPCEGMSLTLTATKRDMELTVRNTDVMNYIVWEPNQMKLEKLVDGTWYVMEQEYTWRGVTEALSPRDEVCTLSYRWRDTFPRNLSSGEYRLVFTFWAMTKNEEGILRQTDNFVLIEEFAIN